MFELIQDWGLEQACVGADVFSPIPRWFTKHRCCRALASEDRLVVEAIKKSTCVNSFWQSSRQHADKVIPRRHAGYFDMAVSYTGRNEKGYQATANQEGLGLAKSFHFMFNFPA